MTIPALVLAGGLGTRLQSITGDQFPKPMAPVLRGGVAYPFLEFPLAHLRSCGIIEIVICLGHLGEQIRTYFGDGHKFGLKLRYDDAGDAGTATRVRRACRHLDASQYLVLCGDVFQALDIHDFLAEFERHPQWAMQLSVYRDRGQAGAPNLRVGEGGLVTGYDRAGVDGAEVGADAGVLVMRDSALMHFDETRDLSLAPDIYRALIRRRQLGAVPTLTQFFDIGTPAGYRRFRAFVAKGGAVPLPRSSRC